LLQDENANRFIGVTARVVVLREKVAKAAAKTQNTTHGFVIAKQAVSVEYALRKEVR
jgi:hypothetical protein